MGGIKSALVIEGEGRRYLWVREARERINFQKWRHPLLETSILLKTPKEGKHRESLLKLRQYIGCAHVP
jgi:hypothetical protein